MAIRAYLGLRLRAVRFADANKARVVLLNLLDGLWGVFDAIVADRLSNGAVAILRDSLDSGQIGYAGARRAQDQEY